MSALILVASSDPKRLVRLKKCQTGGEQMRVAETAANPVGGQSGEFKEPLGPTFVSERRRKRRQCQHVIVGWWNERHRILWKRKTEGKQLAKILVVEDNALNIKLFCDLLAAHGHEPEAVTDSREALDTARAFKPDLVITDIQLPHVSGIELMELIRETGSIRQAAGRMDMSYRRAWLLVDELNHLFRAPSIETKQGGKSGGGAALTAFGEELLKRFRAMEKRTMAALAEDIAWLSEHRSDQVAAPTGEPGRR